MSFDALPFAHHLSVCCSLHYMMNSTMKNAMKNAMKTTPLATFAAMLTMVDTEPDRCRARLRSHKMLTARAARITMIVSEILACTMTSDFAQRDSTDVSAGESAVLKLNARNR